MSDHLYERVRFTDVLNNGEVVELDAIHALTSMWPDVLADEPSFTSWRIGHLPSGWTIAIEPISIALPRFLASCPDASRRLAGGS